MPKHQYHIMDFSKYLFWDVDVASLELERSAPYIIERVLEYGQMEDWNLLKKIYGLDKIREVALNIRSMDKVTLSFVSTIFNIEKQNFKCFKDSQLTTSLWNC